MVREIPIDYGSGRIVRFVRQYGHRNRAILQFGQQFRYTGIRPGIVSPAFRVVSGNNFSAPVHRFIVLVVFGQGPPGKTTGAVTDKTPETFNRMRRKAQLLQPGIRSAGNIGKRVEQRAVEVEKYCLKFDWFNLL